MIKMKAGGMILTGCAAFLVAGKVVNSLDHAVGKICETIKWRGYYKCWSKGDADGEPVAPGYSVTTRPDKANYEIVKDPSGKDHAKDNEPKEPQNTDSAKAVVEAVKAIAEKVVDNLTKPSGEPTEASEGEIEASERDSDASPDADLENVIEGAFEWSSSGDADSDDIVVKEFEDHETVD